MFEKTVYRTRITANMPNKMFAEIFFVIVPCVICYQEFLLLPNIKKIKIFSFLEKLWLLYIIYSTFKDLNFLVFTLFNI